MEQIAVYATCPWCDGHGRIALHPDGPRSEPCTECKGLGFAPTMDGRAIIGLIKIARLDELLPDADVESSSVHVMIEQLFHLGRGGRRRDQ